jgi:hypothetical protein
MLGNGVGTMGLFRDRPDVAIEYFSYSVWDWDGIQYHWDVTAAQKLANQAIRAQSWGRFSVEDTSQLYAMLLDGAAEVDPAYALSPEINLTLPLIAVPLPFPKLPDGRRQHVLIDGWHRVYRAQHEQIPELVLFLLNEAEEQAVRLRPSTPDLVTQVMGIRAERKRAGWPWPYDAPPRDGGAAQPT